MELQVITAMTADNRVWDLGIPGKARGGCQYSSMRNISGGKDKNATSTTMNKILVFNFPENRNM